MFFTPIDLTNWPRREVFEHYLDHVPCSYSMCVELDITPLRTRGQKLYPAMLYALTTVVNRHEEFRTAFRADGQLGTYSQMLPSYTVFHKQTEQFSNLWTVYDPDYPAFLQAYTEDQTRYGDNPGFQGKPNPPENTFPVSMIPWSTFTSFSLHLPKGDRYLLPIFTMGKFFQRESRTLLPLALQVHHAVCDGFHACRFVNELQALIDAGF